MGIKKTRIKEIKEEYYECECSQCGKDFESWHETDICSDCRLKQYRGKRAEPLIGAVITVVDFCNGTDDILALEIRTKDGLRKIRSESENCDDYDIHTLKISRY